MSGLKKKWPSYVLVINTFFVLLFLGFTFFTINNLKLIEALTGGVEFVNDVEVSLDALDNPLYISSGSQADSVELGGTDFEVYGVPESIPFELKTDTHRIFSVSPQDGSADFSLSTLNIAHPGYLSQWTMGTANTIDYILGVGSQEEAYFIERDGSEIEESPQFATSESELVFNSTGDGTYVVESTEGGVVFTEDTILDLEGLEVTVFIAQGSKAGYLRISDTELEVYGIPEGEFFKLKTEEHTVLNVSPVIDTADFSISSSNIDSLGYLNEWYGDSSDSTDFIVGASQANFYYTVLRNGTEIEGSPFLSDSEGDVSFNTYGVGTYNIGISHGVGDAHLRGYAWSDNIGWICFSSQDDPETDVDYGVNLEEGGVLSGYAWSDNVGWISFTEDDLVGCPEGECSAKIENNELIGWAKVLSNDEWISLSGEVNGEEYGPYLVGEDFHDWAWGDTTLGWISFNCLNNNECTTSDYKVWISGLQVVSPTVRTNPATDIDPEGTATLNGTLLGMGGYDEATVWFEWGETDTLGSETLEEEREVLTEVGSFTHEISVVLDETYYFRAVAENEEGMFYGNILGFTVAERSGDIIITFGDFYKGIEISADGKIEIID